MTAIRHSPKTSAFCYVTIRSILSHKSVAMYARFEGQITIFLVFGKMDRKSICGQKSFIPHLLAYCDGSI